MTLEAGKEMDRRCVMNWLMEVYRNPTVAFNTHSDEQQIEFAHDAIVLLKEQEAKIEQLKGYINGFSKDAVPVVRCKYCKHATMTSDGKMCKYCAMDTDDFGNQRDVYHDADWFCADGKKKDDDA